MLISMISSFLSPLCVNALTSGDVYNYITNTKTTYNNLEKTKKTCLTGQYDLEMNLIAVYPSTSEAGRQLGLKNASNISQAIKKGGKSHGYYWREITQIEYENFQNKK